MIRLHCLHGFLGRPSDWDFLRGGPWELNAVDVLRVCSPASGASMVDWAQDFINHSGITSQAPGRHVLLGYSAGARLAMHALLAAPELWDSVILVSGNPGLSSPEERQVRILADEKWALRFEQENWKELIEAWENLPVFRGRPCPLPRHENEYQRPDLAAFLRQWSVGRQDDLLPSLKDFSGRLFWIAGEDDPKYAEMGKTLQTERPGTRLWIAPGAAHRVPWEKRKEFVNQLTHWISA